MQNDEQIAKSWADNLEDMGWGQKHTPFLSGEYLYQVWKGFLQLQEIYSMDMISLSHFSLKKSWVDDLEDMGQSKKLLYMTQLHLVVNTYTKYEKDPLSEVKSIEETRFCLQTDRRTDKQTDKVKPVYPTQINRWGYNKNIFAFLNISQHRDMAQEHEIHPDERQGTNHPIHPKPWWLMCWWSKEPGY